jgi:uncharacterized SAM-binding protein YcdF (DUF218 family)
VGGGVSPAFARRLARAARISAESRIRPILVVGGATTAAAAGTAPLSEAEAGRRFLAQAGIPDEAILKEEHSRHTLENLRHARTAVGLVGTAPFVLVTSRCHLARSLAMARGLGLEPIPCAAEDRLALDPATVLSLLKEAYFLHWYRVGRTWAGWTNSRRSLARIR